MNDVFTTRQREIILLAVQKRMTVSELAQELGIGNQSVRKHLISIYDRLVRSELFSAVLSPPRPVEIRAPTGMIFCKWCSDSEADYFVYHLHGCAEKHGAEMCKESEVSVEIMGEETE